MPNHFACHYSLNGSWLKMIAILSMFIDHIGKYLLICSDSYNEPILTLFGTSVSAYSLTRTIGRLAFPIFCFLLIEGFIHTRNRRKYGLNLLAFAIISEIPWLLLHSGNWPFKSHNVMFTLLFGFLGMLAWEKYKSNIAKQAMAIISLFVLAYIFKADYSWKGFAFIMMLYLLRERSKMPVAAIAGTGLLAKSPLLTTGVLTAFIPISLYNGERGFIKGNYAKYLFYVFYPSHLLLIYLIKYWWMN